MSDFISMEIDPKDLLWMDVRFNPNRVEYNDFTPLWQSVAMQKLLAENFVEMFKTGGWGKWSITPKTKAYKAKKGIPGIGGLPEGAPNVWSGRMMVALVRPRGEGGLRIYSRKYMDWGVNLLATSFSVRGQYPRYPAEKNPFAMLSRDKTTDITKLIGLYIINVFREKSGLPTL